MHLLADKLVVIKVALVNGEHVYQHQSGEDGECNLAFQLALAIKEYRYCSENDEQQAAQGVLAEDGHADVLELSGKVGVDRTVLATAQRGELLRLGLTKEAEEEFGSKVEQ